MMRKAAIDNDFIQQIADIRVDDESVTPVDLARELFTGLCVSPVMHELVYQNELMIEGIPDTRKQRYTPFFQENVVSVTRLDEFLDSEAKRNYYRSVFAEVYEDFAGDFEKLSIHDIMTEWRAGKSLGEVHSVVMCLMTACGIFLSDDDDSHSLRKIIESKYLFSIDVLDRKAACDQAEGLAKKHRRMLTHKER